MTMRGAGGFTLVELLVVLVVMALLAALASPEFHRALPGLELRANASDIAAALRGARSAAIRDNRETTVAIDVDANRYRLKKWHALRGDVRLSLYTAERERLDRGTGRIRFFPDGTSTGGRVSLAEGERSYHVVVDWLTGRVDVVQ